MVEEATKPPPHKSFKKTKGRDKASPSKAQVHERTLSLVIQNKGETKANMSSLGKTPMTLSKDNGKKKVHKPREVSHEHIDFHFSNGDVHSLIFLMNQLKKKKASRPWNVKKWTNLLRHKRKQVQKRWTKCPRNFWPSLMPSKCLWCNKGKLQHITTKWPSSWVESQKDWVSSMVRAPSGRSKKVTINLKLLDSFARKETKTKRVWLWLHQIEVYMEMQHFKTNKKWKHFIQTLLKEHMWVW